MRIPPGSYIEIKYELSYMEGGEKRVIVTTKKILRKQKIDEKTNKVKIVEEVIDKPTIIKLGSGELPKFFEDHILGVDLELNKPYETSFPPEKAYGKRDPSKIMTISAKKFREKVDKNEFVLEGGGRKPRAGDVVYMNIGATPLYFGRIIRATDRSVIIDTNHPLAGKTISATYTITKVVQPTDSKDERMRMLIEKFFGDVGRYIEFEFRNDMVELRVKNEYFDKYGELDREIAKKILEDIYIPKLILMSNKSELYGEFGVSKIRWVEEREIIKAKIEESKQIQETTAEESSH